MTPLILFAARTFAELLIDCAEDRALRAMLVGMLPKKPGYRTSD